MLFYAVAIGRKCGIYRTHEEYLKQVKDFHGRIDDIFDTFEKAENFMKENFKLKEVPSFRGEPFTKADIKSQKDVEKNSEGWIVVYTDGACIGNGKRNAYAGIGVFWADNHQDNVSQPLDGRQTNNRAELQAAIIAIRQAKQNGHEKIVVRTDSNYVIYSATCWIDHWLKNGWKTFNGKAVKNKQDFVELIGLMSDMERVTWEKVKSKKIYGNKKADKLACKGIPPTPMFYSDGTIVAYIHGAWTKEKQRKYVGLSVFWADDYETMSQLLDKGQSKNNQPNCAKIHAAIIAIQHAIDKGCNKIVVRTDSKSWIENGLKTLNDQPDKNKHSEDFQKLFNVISKIKVNWEQVCPGIYGYDKAVQLIADINVGQSLSDSKSLLINT